MFRDIVRHVKIGHAATLASRLALVAAVGLATSFADAQSSVNRQLERQRIREAQLQRQREEARRDSDNINDRPGPRTLPPRVEESTLGGLRLEQDDVVAREQALARQRALEVTMQREMEERLGRDLQPDELQGIRDRAAEQAGVNAFPEIEAIEDDEYLIIEPLAEPFQLAQIIDIIIDALDINLLNPEQGYTGSVSFNSELRIRKDRLLEFMTFLLSQYDYGLTLDADSNVYVIEQTGALPRIFDGDLATTKVLRVPNLRPSSLETSINAVLSSGGGNTGGNRGAAAAGGGSNASVSFVDELGLVVITGSARQIALVEDYIDLLRQRNSELELFPIELEVIAASVAKQRILALFGGSSGTQPGRTTGGGAAAAQAGGAAALGATTSVGLENVAERLSIDPQGNRLLFRGTEDELTLVRQYVELIDRPIELEPMKFFAGGSAKQIAEIARTQGLGEIIELAQGQGAGLGLGGAGGAGGQIAASPAGGPTMVVDVDRGEIIYYGTPEQQRVLATLIETLETEADRVVIREYRLDNADAEEVAGIIQSLIQGTSQTGEATLLPQARGGGGQTAAQTRPAGFTQQNSADDGEIGDIDPTQVFVVPDPANNQIIVKAPLNQQGEFRELVRRLDRRRPQVYIEATIVSVSDSDAFNLTIELADFSAGEAEFQNNFGLSSFGDVITTIPTVTGAASGFNAAILQSTFVPFVVNTLKTRTDAQIISQPQLLVNDNEEAQIASVLEQPTTAQAVNANTTQVSFSGFEQAGTTLTVTPTIAEAGHISLTYSVEFSDFIGAPSADGIPAPRINQNVTGSATIPSDSTIVVGGIVVRDINNTRTRIPLLGEIPLIEYLFGTTSKTTSETILYIFITPRVLTDPNFNDLKLLTRGPRETVQWNGGVTAPPLTPRFLEFSSLSLPVPEGESIFGFNEGDPATPPAEPDPTRPVALDTARSQIRETGEPGN
ncbi:MAG: secretin N-terminal domain-containing protein [Planctomycetota bacterium]